MIIQKVAESVAITATDSPKSKLTKSTPSSRCSSVDDAFVFHDPKGTDKLSTDRPTPQANPKMRR
jgi:hypothetical protein